MSVLLENLKGLTALDLETNGTQAVTSDIVGIGLASAESILYFDWKGLSEEAAAALREHLAHNCQLIAHNLFFDAAFLLKLGWVLPWKACTYATYRFLANEGFEGQTWGLKDAQVELLGWTETNETELDAWLVSNGHYRDIKLSQKEGYVPVNGKYYSPDKSKMHLAPCSILGHYCALDAASTYLLYTEILLPSLEKLGSKEAITSFDSYSDMFTRHILRHVDQQLCGIAVDQSLLLTHKSTLEANIRKTSQEFLEHPQIKPVIEEYNQLTLSGLANAEPNQLKKNGEVSKNWLKWKDKYEGARRINHFNIGSGEQKRWLFYYKLKYPVLLKTENNTPSMDGRALLGFGEPGRILTQIDEANKELGYVEGCFEHLIEGRIHPQFRMPGTLTGRLSGSGGINVQQLPKSRGYLSCWVPRPGHVFVDCDESSLEQVVLAELSKDPSLWKLYGPGSKKNDVYLFNGAYLPKLGDAIRAAGYDPENPTAEGIASAKKEAKHERGISKVITLGSSYGMGPNKIQMTLKLQGINISKSEAFDMWQSYWELYAGVKDYEKSLVEEWRWRGGWVFNGIGRPISVSEAYLKDIVNRVVQSTGHDVHVALVDILYKLLEEKDIPFLPVILDLHDQAIVSCEERFAEEVRLTFSEAYAILNQEYLQGKIPITGEAKIVQNLAQAKLEE